MLNGSENKTRRSCWIERTELEKGLLALLLIAALLISTLGVLLFLYTNSTEFCASPVCIKSALEILSRIDTTTDPCEDFYAFSCNNMPKDANLDLFDEQQKLENSRIEAMYSEPIQDDDHPLVKVQKKMYEACMNEPAIAEDAFITLQEILRTAGGWPVLEENWNEAKFDWKQTTYKLRQLGYHYSSFLEVSLVPDPNNTQKYIFQVSLPEVSDVYSKWFDSDEPVGFMTSVATAFGAPSYRRAMPEMSQTHQFLKELQRLKNNTITEDDTTFHRATVERFPRKEKAIKWIEFINTIVSPYARVSKNDEVLFPSERALDEWLGVLERTSKRTLANYMMWRVVEEALPYLTEQLKNGRVRPRLMASSEWGSRSEFCIDEIEKRFLPSHIRVMHVRKYLPEEKKQAVEEIGNDMKMELLDVIKKVKWLDSKAKKDVRNEVNNLNIVAGALENYFDDEIFDNMSLDLNISGNNFLNMLSQANRNTQDRLYGLIDKSPQKTRIVYTGLVENAVFFEMGDLVSIVTYLQDPIFNEKRPNYLNYANAGIVAKKDLLEVFRHSKSNKTKKVLEENEKCLVVSTAPENISVFENVPVRELIEHNLGLKVSYEAYKKWAKNNEELPLAFMDYTPQQLFWMSSGYFFCRYAELDASIYNMDLESKEAYSTLVSKIVNNNPDLARDFECPETPEETCKLF